MRLGLPSRSERERRWQEIPKRAGSLCLLLYDIEGFREINSRNGSPFGDKLLVEVGHRLNEVAADRGRVEAIRQIRRDLPDTEVVVDTLRGDPLRLDGPQAVGDFIGNAIAEFDFFEFVILNTRIFLNHLTGGDQDVATARMYMNELRHESAAGGRWT